MEGGTFTFCLWKVGQNIYLLPVEGGTFTFRLWKVGHLPFACGRWNIYLSPVEGRAEHLPFACARWDKTFTFCLCKVGHLPFAYRCEVGHLPFACARWDIYLLPVEGGTFSFRDLEDFIVRASTAELLKYFIKLGFNTILKAKEETFLKWHGYSVVFLFLLKTKIVRTC